MCGIFGVVRPHGSVAPSVLETGCDALRHRGPDDRGQLTFGPFGIAMTRLAIIDLAGGHQPITTPDGRYSIVFNGEIYNHRELRVDLEAGYPFATQSDTEVILAGFARHGAGFFERLNGIFAVAILDRTESALTLARDHLGVKPLYLHEGPGVVAFASELKPILAALSPDLSLDRVALHQALSSAYVFTPRTMFESIRQVPAGTLVRIAADGTKKVERFWELGRKAPPARLDLPSIREELRARLRLAVKRQLLADVPIGLLLSSGVDSMALLALMAEQIGGQQAIETFTVGSDSDAMDEARFVKQVTGRFPIRAHFVELGAREIEAEFDNLARAYDNLEVLPTALALFFAGKAAGHGRLKVVLAGNGGDELFFGYPTYKATRWQGALRRLAPFLRAGRPILSPRLDRLSLRFKVDRLLEGLALSPDAAHFAWRSIATRADRHALTAGRATALPDDAGLYPVELIARGRELGFEGLDAYSYADARSWLVDSGLMMWDKAGMAHSLEIRVPLLDRELVEWAFSLPFAIRGRGLGKKALLREALEGIVPREILELPKRGFHIPISQWLAGPLQGFFRERTRALPDALVDGRVVERLWEEHLGGREDNGFALWVLACLSSWHRQLVAPRSVRA